ncbi:hypothetical protein [Companilactobacillus mishanensis]|uniref:Lipoprotein n=1 Tax=Companilactobacillus mishanensis TaxID=2486008 RepID=A0ABW9P4X2_9LACO|nr:hypothetical protein [Companilactobacillus mishanensis]MQS44154.1 hypothetical protein [Companilactobacillus mishanensis]
MKKTKYFLLLLIPIFFMVLSGCSSLSLKTTKNEYNANGLVAVIKGKATKTKKLTYTVAGVTKKVSMNEGHFAFTVPTTSNQQDVKIVASDGSATQTKIVTVNKEKPLTDYTALAQQYNYNALMVDRPTDQLPLIVKDGIFTYKQPTGTTLYFNVQSNYLMGIAMKCQYKDLKSETGLKNFGMSLYTMSELAGADGKAVTKNLQKQMKNMDNGNKTTMKQITSKGVHVNINLAGNAFYVYITK